MYKLNKKTQTIVEISNTEFSNDFRLVNPNIVVSVLSGIQSIARLDDSFYSTDFEILEYLRDDSDMVERCQLLDAFTLNSVTFFGENAAVQDDVFSKYMRGQLVGSHFEEWPFISNLPQAKYYSIQAAYEALLEKDASDSINVFTVCESLLNKKCCAFNFMNVIDTLQRIESASVDQLLDMKIELPNNRYLKIKSPVGLLHSSDPNSRMLVNGVYVEHIHRGLDFYKGLSTPFKANRAEDWCDITDSIFLITGVYSQTSNFMNNVGEPQPISCMLYILNKFSSTSRPNHQNALLDVHKYLLKDHFLRLVVCNRTDAEDPITSLLPTKDIFRGVNTGIKDLKSFLKFNNFLVNSSPALKQAIILQPQFQTAMDVSSDLLAEVYRYYVQNILFRKDTLDTMFSQNKQLQLDKVRTLKQFCLVPKYYTKEPWNV